MLYPYHHTFDTFITLILNCKKNISSERNFSYTTKEFDKTLS